MVANTAQVVVPELHCPVRSAISRYAEALNDHATNWIRKKNLSTEEEQVDRYIRSDFGTFAARVCPNADLAGLMLYTEWLTFGFFYDDRFFDEGDGCTDPRAAADAAMAAVSAFAPGGLTTAQPWQTEPDRRFRRDVLAELLVRTERMARPEQFSRFCTQMTIWFYSYLYEPVLQSAGRPATLFGYTTNRLYNIASAPYVTLTEIITGSRTSTDELATAELRTLSGLAAYQMAWCNDIHSAAREASVNELVENLPSLLRRIGQRGTRPAMDEAVRVHNETMRAYLELEHTVLNGASPGVREYVIILRTWMRGHYDWCRATLRYVHENT